MAPRGTVGVREGAPTVDTGGDTESSEGNGISGNRGGWSLACVIEEVE